MNILSINFATHDTSSCIVSNGIVKYYFKEERFSRIKRDDNPLTSIIYCLENFKDNIDLCVIIGYPNAKSLINVIRKLTKYKIDSIVDFSYKHHLAHAALAFYNSGFEESLVFVVDGQGSYYKNHIVESETVFYAKYPNNFEYLIQNLSVNYSRNLNLFSTIEQEYDTNIIKHEQYECNINYLGDGGIVNVYNTATALISQQILENGKTMGLSSYGTKVEYPQFFDSNSQVNWDLFTKDSPHTRLYRKHQGKVIKEITEKNYKFYANYAYEVQIQTQNAVVNLIKKSVEKTGCKNICIVGGYGMNIVANHYYTKVLPELNFYFEPISDDSGLSIGAAMYFHYRHTNSMKINPLKTTNFHGINYDISSFRGNTTKLKEISKILYDNKSIAIYRGYAEVGQRALGNRSIFFNALNPSAKKIVNTIKKREWYRPFACVVLEEDSNEYFEMGNIKSSKFMTMCFPVRPEYINIIPGIVHIDNTCRIQTVSKEDEYLYELLQEFKKLSGHGILLNTSFNLAGDPLVETPEDAFKTLNESCLDYLWFEETQQLFKNKNL